MNAEGNKGSNLPENWLKMTPEQKRQWRLNNFLNPTNINFINEEAKKDYLVRARRLVDVYNVEEPGRVPVNLPVGNLPYSLSGVSERTAMYDYQQAVEACRKFNDRYSAELEYYAVPFITPGKVLDLLGYNLYAWPGHGLPLDADGVQFIEGEYMLGEEYDDFIRDPSWFWLNTYFPRVFKTFEPFKLCQPPTDLVEIVQIGQLGITGNSQMQEVLVKISEIGREYQNLQQITGPHMVMGPAHGFPPYSYGRASAKAPFDTLGDTLRGTAGLMKDMYRRPDKVLEACDKIADLTINSILKSPRNFQNIMVNYPLHKGADGWMSQKQFETFYWPPLKKVMNALINEGFIQRLFAEGGFNTRLEYVNEFPKGSVIWMFDQTDMSRAKKILGNNCCIEGNVPASLLATGEPRDVKTCCRKLIEDCGKGGGYILSSGCVGFSPKLENLTAMMEAVREYGVYKR